MAKKIRRKPVYKSGNLIVSNSNNYSPFFNKSKSLFNFNSKSKIKSKVNSSMVNPYRGSSPFLIKPSSKKNLKNLRWTQAINRFPNLNPFGDEDKDGVRNMFDCRPFDKRRQEDFPSDESEGKSGKDKDKNKKKKKQEQRKSSPLRRLESRYQKAMKLTAKYPSQAQIEKQKEKQMKMSAQELIDIAEQKPTRLEELQSQYGAKVLEPKEARAKAELEKRLKRETSPMYIRAKAAEAKMAAVGKKVGEVKKALDRRYTASSIMDQRLYAAKIKRAASAMMDVASPKGERKLVEAVGLGVFEGASSEVRRTGRRGRPSGTVMYRDDSGNPIGVYEWRKLQRLKLKRIKLQTAMAEAARAQAMAAAQGRQSNIPQEMSANLPQEEPGAIVSIENGQVVDVTPEQQMSRSQMSQMQAPQMQQSQRPQMKAPQSMQELLIQRQMMQQAQSQSQMPQQRQMSPEQIQYMRYVQQMQAKRMAAQDNPQTYRHPEDTAQNPWGVKSRFKLNFGDSHILRADQGGNILHVEDNILNAPNVMNPSKDNRLREMENQRLRGMDEFNRQQQQQMPAQSATQGRIIKTKGGGYIRVD